MKFLDVVERLTRMGAPPVNLKRPAGVSRRDFLRACGVTAATVAMPASVVGAAQEPIVVPIRPTGWYGWSFIQMSPVSDDPIRGVSGPAAANNFLDRWERSVVAHDEETGVVVTETRLSMDHLSEDQRTALTRLLKKPF